MDVTPKIEIPADLCSAEAAAGPRTYHLYAAILHAGKAVTNGHYFAYVLHNGTWYRANNDHVTVADGESVQENIQRMGYMLFYERGRPMGDLYLTEEEAAEIDAAMAAIKEEDWKNAVAEQKMSVHYK